MNDEKLVEWLKANRFVTLLEYKAYTLTRTQAGLKPLPIQEWMRAQYPATYHAYLLRTQ